MLSQTTSLVDREHEYAAFVRSLEPERDTRRIEARDIPIRGRMPMELEGTLYRIGASQRVMPPNGARGLHLFDGDGLLHAFEIVAGRVSYVSRFVESASFWSEQRAGYVNQHLLGYTSQRPDGVHFVRAQYNTNVVAHAGRLLALVESAPPFEVEPQSLAPLGPLDFGGRLLGRSVAAHPKLDPRTGQLLFHAHQLMPPFFAFYVLEADGRCSLARYVAGPHTSMVHDLAITRRYAILPAGEVSMSARVTELGVEIEDSLVHRPEHGMQLIVIDRATGEALPWLRAPGGGHVFHVANAFERPDGLIELDAVVYDDVRELIDFLRHVRSGRRYESFHGELCTYVIDPQRGLVSERRWGVHGVEFPRIDERCTAGVHRYIYALESDRAARPALPWKHVVKIDRRDGSCTRHDFGNACYAAEPVFVPRSNDSAEDDGYLLTVVYDGSTDQSRLVVLDACDIAAPPLAEALLPCRVPFGFHGSFVPDVL